MNREQRRYLRKHQARRAAEAREAADPWQQARERVRELHGPPAAQLVIDAQAERHRKLGRKLSQEPLFIGYGAGSEAEQRHHGARRTPGLAELTGRARRTVIRAQRWLVQHQVLNCAPGGGPCWREARRDREGLRGRWSLIGRGGCDKGGQGLANMYWPPGVPDPDPDPPPPPPPPPGVQMERPEGWQRVRAQLEEREQQRLRRRAAEQARGP